jgi:hypothetical protein
MGPLSEARCPTRLRGLTFNLDRLAVRAPVRTGQALRRTRPVSQRARTTNQGSRLPRRLSGLLCLDLTAEN